MARILAVRNFEEFQHYRDRSPPWIKLHNSVLENYDFAALPDAAKWHLAAIWLLASRSNNRIPDDPAWVAAKISARSKVDLGALVDAGFLVVISEATTNGADRKRDASETLERGEERESRAEGEERRIISPIGSSLLVFDQRVWPIWKRKEAKRAAFKAWQAACKRADPEVIIAGLNRWRPPDDPKFIPLLASWLNADRWLDEQPPAHVLARPPPGQAMRDQLAGLASLVTEPAHDDPSPPPDPRQAVRGLPRPTS